MATKAIDKETGKELNRVHIWMDPRDIEWIDLVFGESIGRSRAIRLIISKYRKTIDEKTNQQAQPITKIEVEI